MFQSAAASWTRRNVRRASLAELALDVSIRRRVVDAAECLRYADHHPPFFVSIRRRVVDAAEFLSLKRLQLFDSVSIRRRVVDAAEWRSAQYDLAWLLVSIRRRVVDAAEYRRPPCHFASARSFNPPPRRGRGGIT